MIDIRCKWNIKAEQREIVGVFGLQGGIGVSHLCVALYQYMESAMNFASAIIDFSASKDLCRMEGAKKHSLCVFDGDEDGVGRAMEGRCTHLILDLGCSLAGKRNDFYYCSRRIILGSLQPWKEEAFGRFLESAADSPLPLEEALFLVNCPSEKAVHEYGKKYHVTMLQMPFIQNPYRIDRGLYEFLQMIMR